MADYPDPDEEYELMYADELELLREEENHREPNVIKKKPLPAKRSLDFSSPVQKPAEKNKAAIDNPISNSQISLTPSLQPMEELLTPPTTSSKRTAEELFGDIADIELDDIQLPSKRQKTDEENDFDLINKIIEGRRLRQMLLETTGGMQNELRPAYNAKENLSLDIPRWAFIPITNSDGDRVYVRLESEESWDKSLEAGVDQSTLHASYLKTWEEARKILETKQQQHIQESQTEDLDVNGNSLWVDKYRPESYVDLLSEEPVNRALLHWLHLWDKIVFKKEVKTKEPQQRNSFSKRAGQFQLSNKWRGKKEAEPEVDEDGRPHHRVALLCGPPGVGKTTLAHLLARLAGYRPVELNASDERSTEAFRTALTNATLMRSVLDAEKRPNCLILDEIDGAPLPTVELLVKWCTATVADSKKKAQSQPLRRPVIAICNDLYATSLRPLRPVALVIHVGGVSAARLSNRLQAVAARERVPLAARAISALAARAQGDVRAAIQLLSFVKARPGTQLSVADMENVAIGTKDCSRSLLQALQAIFSVNDKDPDGVMKTINAAGEYDRLADGIFENYITSRVDSRLLIACETLSWLRLQDAVSSWTMRHQNYSLYGLLPICLASCHRILATRAPTRVKFPFQAQEMSRKKAELDAIAWAVRRGSSASVCVSYNALRRDLLPLLPYLLAPSLRSANLQLCSENERRAVKSVAGAMCDYGLQYEQRRAADGLYAFQLEPDVCRLAFFGNEERMRPPPAVRQAIAREQQLEMIRRSEEMANRVPSRAPSSQPPVKKDPKPANEMKAPLPNHLQRLKPKEVEKTTPQVHKDFFGRIVPLSQVQRSGVQPNNISRKVGISRNGKDRMLRDIRHAVSDVISSSSVFYQYREGFNNAVRRNVRMRDIL